MNKRSNRLQNSVSNISDQAAQTRVAAERAAKETAKYIGDAIGTSSEAVQDAAQGMWSGAEDLANQLQKLPGDVVDRMFPECPVPMFILPTGPDPEKYCIVFGFDEVFDNLKSGVFVRPKIEAWAAEDFGYDLERLSENIKVEFTSQFERTRDRMVKSGEVNINSLESRIQRQNAAMSEKLAGSVSSFVQFPFWTTAAVATGTLGIWFPPSLLVTGPITLIYFGIAVYRGHRTFGLMSDYFRLMSDRGQDRRLLREEQSRLDELEEEFHSKNKAFQEAVGNIDLRVHPCLKTFRQLICEQENVLFQDCDTPVSAKIPDAIPFLENSDFQQRLPRRYRNLIQLI